MKLLLYVLFEKIYIYTIFQHWKWPAQGTSTVLIVSTQWSEGMQGAHLHFLDHIGYPVQ